MNTRASVRGKSASTAGVLGKDPTVELAVPVKDVETVETIALGFRQSLFEINDGDEPVGGIDTGVGTDAIVLKWGDKTAVIKGRDLLRAWVRTFDPDSADALP